MTLALSLDDKGACNACASSRREGRPSPFFDLDLGFLTKTLFRWTQSAWTLSLRLLRRASRPTSPTTPMGTTSPERTPASGDRTLEDAVRQLPSRSTRCSFRLHLDCEGLDARDRSSSMSSSPTSAGPQHLWWHASPARMVSRQHPPPFTGGSERVRNASHQTSRARRDL